MKDLQAFNLYSSKIELLEPIIHDHGSTTTIP